MKITTNLLLAGAMAMLFGSVANAQTLVGSQIVYSHSFNGSAVSVDLTPPTQANTINGGVASAVWTCTYTNQNASIPNCGTLYQNGVIGTNVGCALLPLAPQPGVVYFLTGNVTESSPGWAAQVMMGFAAANCSQSPYFNTNIAFARFSDGPPTGYAWLWCNIGTCEFFQGPKAATPDVGNFVDMGVVNTNYTWTIMLNTLGAQWTTAAWINGNQLGTNMVYSSNPTAIQFCGVGEYSWVGRNPALAQWNYFTVTTAALPVITKQPASASISAGSAYTNTVVAVANTNGGTLFYQWFTNGVSAANATTNASFIFNPVTLADAGLNDFVVVSNTYGSVTSSVFSVTVNSSPVFTTLLPITLTNLATLYGGTNVLGTNYLGSSPSFLVAASGSAPLAFQWRTNGVAVSGATNASFGITNCQLSSPTNFSCVVTNIAGKATNTWLFAYEPATMAPFPQAVLAGRPVAYWRLNDVDIDGADNGSGDNGYVCNDYESANNGIYTNAALGNPGYDTSTDPNEFSALFAYVATPSSYAYDLGTNIDFSTKTNAEFTVACWAESPQSQANHAGLVSKGYLGGEEFTLDNNAAFDLEFLVRNGAGTAASAVSSYRLGSDSNWHFIVGVCDQTNGILSLYVDGALVAGTNIPPGSGVYNASTVPITIGARDSTPASSGNLQYEGSLNEAAIYNYAFTPSNVATLFQSAGGTIAPYFLNPLPITNVVVAGTTNLTIAATVFGSTNLGYYWITNGNTASVLGSGVSTTLAPLNASLTTTVDTNWWGDTLELMVTNAFGTATWSVTISAPLPPPPPPIVLDYSTLFIYSNTFPSGIEHVSLNGFPAAAANFLVGGTNAVWICTYTNASPLSGTVYTDGTVGTNSGNALLPFTPEPGFIYTLTASLNALSVMNNWVSFGFSEYATQQSVEGFTRFVDTPPTGFAWMYVQNGSAVYEPGPAGIPGALGSGSSGLPGANAATFQIVLNTVTNDAWTATAYDANGVGIATNTYAVNPPIHYVGLGENQLTAGSAGIEWNSMTLTAMSPNGFPPYLLAPLPPTSILLTNSTVTISASGFGTGPWGYYWINNSNVIASGTTNDTAPLGANLSVPTSSLTAGPLELVLTNALGTNTTIITLVSPINPNPPKMGFSFTNNLLTLTWLTNTGWQLQAQTNSLAVGLSTNWVNVANTTATNQFVIPVRATNASVFYRLVNP